MRKRRNKKMDENMFKFEAELTPEQLYLMVSAIKGDE